jgi:hypothetical protein
MKVYIASVFADKDRVAKRLKELRHLGIGVTSRWTAEAGTKNSTIKDYSREYFRNTAICDVEDILDADVMVLTIPEPELMLNLTAHQLSRGGRNFESGLVYGWMLAAAEMLDYLPKKTLIVMGAEENVFHFLDGKAKAKKFPRIIVLPTWEKVKKYLKRLNTKGGM